MPVTLATITSCPPWCPGGCDEGDGEAFHRTVVNSEGSESGDAVGVELVRNDEPGDGPASPHIDITYSRRGLTTAVTSLDLDAARRHARAVLRAVRAAEHQESTS
jgi:hypothetical protein